MNFGLALLPDEELAERLVAFQERHEKELDGPTLGMEENLPHVSILQCPFVKEHLTETLLGEIRDMLEQPNPTAVLSHVSYQPVGWAFANLVKEPWMSRLQADALPLLEMFIDSGKIDTSKDFAGYSRQEVAYYSRYGYRYLFEEFRPHFTIGRTSSGSTSVSAALQKDFLKYFAGVAVRFRKLAFYQAGAHGAFARSLAEIDLQSSKA